MAYFVLALGVLMSAAGLDAIATGYPIIQIERGWTTVIAGSALLTGGLVVISLGLVLRTLIGIKATLQTRPFLASADAKGAAADSRIADTPRPATEARDDPSFAAGGLALAAAVPAAILAEETFKPHEEPHAAKGLDMEPSLVEASTFETETSAGIEPHVGAAPEKVEPPPFDSYELQTPSTPDHDLAPPPTGRPHPAEPESADDWLDHAFSVIDQDLAAGSGTTITHPEAAHRAEQVELEKPLQGESASDEPAAAAGAHDTASVPASSDESHATDVDPEPEPAPHDLVVIGRYEADGTSYVMYSDGSIEAQSDAGVYRFGSMAELKAFIEG